VDPGVIRSLRTTPPNWTAIRAVLAKDLRAVRRSKAVILPMLLCCACIAVGAFMFGAALATALKQVG